MSRNMRNKGRKHLRSQLWKISAAITPIVIGAVTGKLAKHKIGLVISEFETVRHQKPAVFGTPPV